MRIVKQNRFKNLGELYKEWTEAGVKASTTHRRVKEFVYSCRQRRLFLKTNITAPIYQDILEHFMLPSADQIFKDADFIFQQDLAPAHTAKSTKSWLNDWPNKHDQQKLVCLTSLNPIESLIKLTNLSPPCHAELRQ